MRIDLRIWDLSTTENIYKCFINHRENLFLYRRELTWSEYQWRWNGGNGKNEGRIEEELICHRLQFIPSSRKIYYFQNVSFQLLKVYLYLFVLVVCSHIRAQIVILKEWRIISPFQTCFIGIFIAYSHFLQRTLRKNLKRLRALYISQQLFSKRRFWNTGIFM